VLLSDIDGLYTAPPQKDPAAQLLPVVPKITAEIEAMAGGAASELSRGGMTTKVEAAKIATAGGAHLMIANGKRDHPLRAVLEGGACTWFLSPSTPVTARKRWIGGTLEPRGTLIVDDGAARRCFRARACCRPVWFGSRAISRAAMRCWCAVSPAARSRAGWSPMMQPDALRIQGRKTGDIARLLGFPGVQR
jgi:glutamate 5-kinase